MIRMMSQEEGAEAIKIEAAMRSLHELRKCSTLFSGVVT